ncbi:MAG TPA: dihydrodipicolinate synthase family protein [Bacteroidota bacterium]|nr:dihydrodipicolinate synthase family protein [Bacteroidota bacterium]
MLKGVFSVLPTPFLSDETVDVPGLKKVIDLYLGAGVNGITALGVTSEAARMGEKDRILVLETIMKHVNGKVPVVVGASAEGLQTCLDLTKAARKIGAAAVMISPPRLPKLNSAAVLNHFRTVADSSDATIILQDYPPVSGFTMEPALLARIAKEIPSVKGIKLEDPPTPLKISRVLEQMDGRPIEIVGGLGGTYLFEELMAGGVGAMTGFAIPEILVKVVGLFHDGKKDEAADFFYRTVALMRFEFQEGIGMAVRKEMIRRRGVPISAVTRAPGARMEDSTLKTLDSMMRWAQTNLKEIRWTLD